MARLQGDNDGEKETCHFGGSMRMRETPVEFY
jgi:hypothetical protein